jgi:hypothetical protein
VVGRVLEEGVEEVAIVDQLLGSGVGTCSLVRRIGRRIVH